MSEETKLMLSGDELTLACNADMILTKRAVIEKTCKLFSDLIPAAQEAFTGHEVLSAAAPKISKGENYRGFPYVIMDHPALFEKENVFAVRTMFWWGHFISVTLHLSGKYKMHFAEHILANISDPFFIVNGEKQWEHHFEEGNYCPASSLTEKDKQRISEKSFLKMALKYDLKDWNNMVNILPEGYKQTAQLLSANKNPDGALAAVGVNPEP